MVNLKTRNMKRAKCNCHKIETQKSIRHFRSKIVIYGGEKGNIKKNNKLQAELTPTFLLNTLLN
jgi:hypothetical protein